MKFLFVKQQTKANIFGHTYDLTPVDSPCQEYGDLGTPYSPCLMSISEKTVHERFMESIYYQLGRQ